MHNVVSFADFGCDDRAMYDRYVAAHRAWALVCSARDSDGRFIGDSNGSCFHGCIKQTLDLGIRSQLPIKAVDYDNHDFPADGELLGVVVDSTDGKFSCFDESTGGESGLHQVNSDQGDRTCSMVDNSLDCQSSGTDGGLNEKTERNRRWRIKERERKKNQKKNKKKKTDSVIDDSGCDELQISLHKKWKVENELAAIKAQRQIDILCANDIDGEIKKYRTNVSAATERNMLSIQKTHGILVASDNIPGQVGTVETLLSSGTISPDSSASMHEFRRLQKENLDLKKEKEDFLKEQAKMHAAFEKAGIPYRIADAFDKATFSDDTDGHILMEELAGHVPDFHYVMRDGNRKVKYGPDPDEYDCYDPAPIVEDYSDDYARNWIERYSYVEKKYCGGMSDEDWARASCVSVAEIIKYKKLKLQIECSSLDSLLKFV